MKRKNNKLIIHLTALTAGLIIFACSKSFLTVAPIGVYSPSTLANRAGVEGLLIGAYSLLDGQGSNVVGTSVYATAQDNWVFGGVCADDSHKGSDPGDQPDIVALMTWDAATTNSYPTQKWQVEYDAINRCNQTLSTMRLATDITASDTLEISSEARFLRAHYYFELAKIFNQVPYVDETINYQIGNWHVPSQSVWPEIEADLTYAMTNLPTTQSDVGRANKYAAEAYLAKAYMFEAKYSAAQPLLNDLIQNGTTQQGLKYALNTVFENNFNPATNHLNDPEAIFSCEMSVDDGSGAANANSGDVLNFPYNGTTSNQPGTCCGFNQPSYSLVNAFKTVNGLPDPDHYNDVDMKNDEGILATDNTYTPYAGTVDPRLDWTAGRRGIPFLDWGLMPGNWARNQASAGPYIDMKSTYFKATASTYTDNSSWTSGYTANNYTFIRYADVLLWAAEVEAQIGSLDLAQSYVNQVRARAANPVSWVKADPSTTPGTPFNYNGYAANYVINTYPAGYFSSAGQARALTLIYFERRLELAMEGHRFFDLRRYGSTASLGAGVTGIAGQLNEYVAHETKVSGYVLLNGAVFTEPKADYFPVPQSEINLSYVNGKPTISQNPGYVQ